MLFSTLAQVSSVFGLLDTRSSQKPLSSGTSLLHASQIPGRTPLRLCPESRDSDLFQISSAIIDRQPVYIDDVFAVHLDGEFTETIGPNATLDMTGNCGSYCDAYNVTDPQDRRGETGTFDFCDFHPLVEQPLGRHHHERPPCPPQKGPAMLSIPGYAFPMFVWWPGYYNFTFDAKTKDGRRIYCLTAEVCLRWEDKEKNDNYYTGPWSNCTWPL